LTGSWGVGPQWSEGAMVFADHGLEICGTRCQNHNKLLSEGLFAWFAELKADHYSKATTQCELWEEFEHQIKLSLRFTHFEDVIVRTNPSTVICDYSITDFAIIDTRPKSSLGTDRPLGLSGGTASSALEQDGLKTNCGGLQERHSAFKADPPSSFLYEGSTAAAFKNGRNVSHPVAGNYPGLPKVKDIIPRNMISQHELTELQEKEPEESKDQTKESKEAPDESKEKEDSKETEDSKDTENSKEPEESKDADESKESDDPKKPDDEKGSDESKDDDAKEKKIEEQEEVKEEKEEEEPMEEETKVGRTDEEKPGESSNEPPDKAPETADEVKEQLEQDITLNLPGSFHQSGDEDEDMKQRKKRKRAKKKARDKQAQDPSTVTLSIEEAMNAIGSKTMKKKVDKGTAPMTTPSTPLARSRRVSFSKEMSISIYDEFRRNLHVNQLPKSPGTPTKKPASRPKSLKIKPVPYPLDTVLGSPFSPIPKKDPQVLSKREQRRLAKEARKVEQAASPKIPSTRETSPNKSVKGNRKEKKNKINKGDASKSAGKAVPSNDQTRETSPSSKPSSPTALRRKNSVHFSKGSLNIVQRRSVIDLPAAVSKELATKPVKSPSRPKEKRKRSTLPEKEPVPETPQLPKKKRRMSVSTMASEAPISGKPPKKSKSQKIEVAAEILPNTEGTTKPNTMSKKQKRQEKAQAKAKKAAKKNKQSQKEPKSGHNRKGSKDQATQTDVSSKTKKETQKPENTEIIEAEQTLLVEELALPVTPPDLEDMIAASVPPTPKCENERPVLRRSSSMPARERRSSWTKGKLWAGQILRRSFVR
jgi:hypothetical protein